MLSADSPFLLGVSSVFTFSEGGLAGRGTDHGWLSDAHSLPPEGKEKMALLGPSKGSDL